MATINVRIRDVTRDALERRAEEEHQSLSDFVRARLEDAVFNFRSDDAEPESEPLTMTRNERHTFALLHRILGRVLPAGAEGEDGDLDYQLERAAVLEHGFTKQYWVEFAGLRPELSPRHCEFVLDVLDMFRIALYSINHLREEGVEVEDSVQRSLRFRGFDHNDALESQMSDYVTFLVKKGRWSEQADFVLGDDRGNSHLQMSEIYSRMLTGYREVKQKRPRDEALSSNFLSEDDLRHISAARRYNSQQASAS